MSDRRPALLLLVAPALTTVLVLSVYPLALSLVSAFTVRDGQLGLDNFVKALELYGADIVFTFVSRSPLGPRLRGDDEFP
jgi:ABC-type sugar transport system permease subunit